MCNFFSSLLVTCSNSSDEVIPGYKLCSQCIIEYNSIVNETDNENVGNDTVDVDECILNEEQTEHDNDYEVYKTPRKKLTPV